MTSSQSDEPVRSRVATNVRTHRQLRGLTLEELSARLEDAAGVSVSAAALLRLEQGRRSIDAGDLVALALVLGVTVADLLAPAAGETGDVLVGPATGVARTGYLAVIGSPEAGLDPELTAEAVVVPAEQVQAIASAFAAVGAAAEAAARQFSQVTSTAATLRTIAAAGHPRAAGDTAVRLLRQHGFTTEQLRDRFGPDAAIS